MLCFPNLGCRARLVALAGALALSCGISAAAQTQPSADPSSERQAPDTKQLAGSGRSTAEAPQRAEQQNGGMISGTVADQSGAALVGAQVKLTRGDLSLAPDAQSGDEGQFSFTKVSPGPFVVTVSANGFVTKTYSGAVNPGETVTVPAITLEVAGTETQVTVEPPKVELAQIQINEEEHQRVLGFIPNFYVSYIPDAAPLDAKQKFELAWRSSVDPVTFGVTAALAGMEQAVDTPKGWGQDAAGYGQRFGALYANDLTSTFLGDFLFPVMFRQDPRYFYKGTGSTRSRLLYAIANAVICKGDNKKWQFNYSYILGDLAASGISNSYYPQKDRGAGLTFENAAIGIGGTAVADILQEFVVRKLTPNLPKFKSDRN